MSKLMGTSKGAKVKIQAVIHTSGKRPRAIQLAQISVKDPEKWGSSIADTLRNLADEFEKTETAVKDLKTELG